MTLNLGDNIRIINKFDDGWAYGVNETTKEEGNFPLACVADDMGYDYDVDSKRDTSLSGYSSKFFKSQASLGRG
jgi:hypothetical protein